MSNIKENKEVKYAWKLEHGNNYVSTTAFDSIEECIADAQEYSEKENVKINSITVLKLAPYEIAVDAENVLQNIWEDAESDVGDWAEDWLDPTDYTTKQLRDLSDRLTGVVSTWLKETDNEPNFCCITEKEEISVCNIPQ